MWLCVYAVDVCKSCTDMYNNDVGKRFMKLKGTLTSATLYFTSYFINLLPTSLLYVCTITMSAYNNDVGKRFMNPKDTLMSATLYFTS
jgi:hypothetical protein